MSTRTTKPREFKDDLADFGVCAHDSSCGVPIKWGFRVISRLGEERFSALSNYGTTEYIGGSWYLVTKTLSRAQAKKLYGENKGDVFGPKGGWKSVTFGDKRFTSELFKLARKPYRETRDGTVCNGIRYNRRGQPVGAE